MHSLRTLVRLALRLHEAWKKRAKLRADFNSHWSSLQSAWTQLLEIKKRLDLAIERNFTHCRASLAEDCRWQIDQLARALGPIREHTNFPAKEPGLADWVQELQSLEEEFGELEINTKQSFLRVTTEPITLQQIPLGPFAIELHWNRLGQERGAHCFQIAALAPNSATGRDEIVHPHVNDGELCAGDATAPIEHALVDGRIGDAFLLIRSVLKTYNTRSAYVQLCEWDGLTCGDCGRRTDREVSSYCPICSSDLCENCSSCCRSCEETRCSGCLNPCESCRDYCCSGCLEKIESGEAVCSSCRGICSDCNAVVLQSTLNDEGQCESCAESEETSSPSVLETIHAS